MTLIISLIDILVVILLLRLLIRPNEAYFDPIYRLIYRITEPLLRVAASFASAVLIQVGLWVAVLVLVRGFMLGSTGAISMAGGIGTSFLEFFQLLFQAYMVMWVVSALTEWGLGSSPPGLIERALYPLNRLSWRYRIRRKYYHLFMVFVLFALYVLLSGCVRFLFFPGALFSMIWPYGLVEAFLLTLGLFPFPGFFSLVIIVGALLSWVSPDPSNPVVRMIYGISEPVLQPFRRILPHFGGLDVSPILALLCFHLLGRFGQYLISGIMKG